MFTAARREDVVKSVRHTDQLTDVAVSRLHQKTVVGD